MRRIQIKKYFAEFGEHIPDHKQTLQYGDAIYVDLAEDGVIDWPMTSHTNWEIPMIQIVRNRCKPWFQMEESRSEHTVDRSM